MKTTKRKRKNTIQFQQFLRGHHNTFYDIHNYATKKL